MPNARGRRNQVRQHARPITATRTCMSISSIAAVFATSTPPLPGQRQSHELANRDDLCVGAALISLDAAPNRWPQRQYVRFELTNAPTSQPAPAEVLHDQTVCNDRYQ